MRALIDMVVSGLLIFAVGFVLWPPRFVYWTAVSAHFGVGLVMMIILGLCLGVGMAVRQFTRITPLRFVIGGTIAYVLGMALIESRMWPDSPVHLLVYGLFLLCMSVGTVARDALARAKAIRQDWADHAPE
jgi:hypothetical protein